MSLPLLEKQRSYQDWSESDKSRILMLGGKTRAEGLFDTSGFSGLSPAATNFAASLHGTENQDTMGAFFNYHPESFKEEYAPCMSDVVASLIFQVI